MATTAKVLAAELKKAQLAIAENESYIAQLEEALRLSNQRHFGVSSEQINPDQTDLFDENIVLNNDVNTTDAPASAAPVHGYSRKARITKAEKLANLPKEYVHYHCSDQERICDTCGGYMSEFGIQTIRINVRYQPEELVAQHHVAHAYKCKYCKVHSDKANVKTAKVAPAFMPTSFASESLVGEILYQKFVLGTPLNRQIPTFADLGLELNRNTMANWVISTSEMLRTFWQVMKDKLLQEPVLHAD
ncbi:transposase [Weissella paramesenteroides]|nr:transposase [Weissella paramesenteroides]KAA8456829.1 transposase [Weissella paramesenteroides]KAA8458362.1 transposase [Weissella paramesenteroides]KAA8459654.1 transposase [Weissella paramesenteroides]KAA8462664.1 transposase [Weissella paramesenteroides]